MIVPLHWTQSSDGVKWCHCLGCCAELGNSLSVSTQLLMCLYQSSIFLNKFWLKAKIAKTCTGLSKELLRKVHTGELGPDGDEVPLYWQANFHKIFARAHLTYLSYQIRSVIVPASFSRLKEKRGTCRGWYSLLWSWNLCLDLPVSLSQMLMKVALGGSLS